MLIVRPEGVEDIEVVRHIHEEAFEGKAEAQLVDLLRARGKLVIALVGEIDGEAAGHIAFSRVSLSSSPQRAGIGLGPMAVRPSAQRRGLGSALVRTGLDHCRALGCEYAVVVGHPEYYPRFGFVPAGRYGFTCTWRVPEEVFMVVALRPNALAGGSGLVSYEPEFDEA